MDVDSLELVRPRSVGVEHVGLWAMDQLALRTGLPELGLSGSLCAAAIGSVIARMARPGSERATRRWLGERSALGELLEVDFQTMGPMQLYRASDALMAHREAIERHLFDRAMGLFDLHPTVTLYDLMTLWNQKCARRGCLLSGFLARRTGTVGRYGLDGNRMANGDRFLSHLHLADEQTHDTLPLGKRHRLRAFAHALKEPFHRRGKGKSRSTIELGGLQGFKLGQDGTLSSVQGSLSFA